MNYAELHCHSAYSFLDGASQPEELAARAAELGYEALALTDHDGVYGSLEFAHAAKDLGVRPITGAEVTLEGGAHVTLLVESARGYANLCRLLTAAHAHLRDLAASLGVRTVATGDVHAHDRSRVTLQDVLVAVRCRTSLEGCERERRGNHESVLLSSAEIEDRFADDRDAVHRTTELAQ